MNKISINNISFRSLYPFSDVMAIAGGIYQGDERLNYGKSAANILGETFEESKLDEFLTEAREKLREKYPDIAELSDDIRIDMEFSSDFNPYLLKKENYHEIMSEFEKYSQYGEYIDIEV